jgi:hypothetical protein
MLLNIRIRLTKPWLGSLPPDHRGIRRFRMDGEKTAVHAEYWKEQFHISALQLHYPINVNTLYPPNGITSASIHLFRRIFSKRRSELFESFRAGTVLTFEFMVREDMPKCPDVAQFKNMFMFVGEYLGLSQFGSKFGFGRFEILDIQLKKYGLDDAAIININSGKEQTLSR